MSKNTGTSELINYFDLGVNGDVGISGNLTLDTIANATTDTDKFLVSDSGVIKYRTGAELLSDIGGQVSGNYVTLDTNQTITGEKLFSGLTLQLAAAGTASPTIIRNTSGTTGSTTGYNTIGFNSSNNIFVDTTNRGGFILGFNNSVSNRTYTLQDASGTLAFTSQIPANPIGGTGTTNYLPKFTGASTIGNSQIFDNGTNVGINTITPNDFVDGESGMAILQSTNGRAVLSLVGTRTDAGEALGRISFTNSLSTNIGAKRLAFISGVRGTTNNSAYLEFAVANDALGTPQMILTQTANLLVGTTTDAGFKLDVNGTGRFSGNQLLLQGGLFPSVTAKATSTFPIFSLVNDQQSAQWNIELGRTTSGNLEFYISGTKIFFTPAGAATFSSSVTAGAGLNVKGYTTASGANYLEMGADVNGYYINGINRTTGGYNQPLYLNGQKIILNSVSSGNVLIGSTSDTGYKLFVNGNTYLRGIDSTSASYALVVQNSSASNLFLVRNDGQATFSSSIDATVLNSTRTSGYLLRENSGSGYGIFKNSTTEIGIAVNGNVALNFASSGAATFSSSVTATSYITSSDARLKEVIEKDGDLAVYKRKGDEQIHYGYLAQEMQQSYPNQVHEAQDGFLSLNYVEILVKKVNELEKKIKQLEK